MNSTAQATIADLHHATIGIADLTGKVDTETETGMAFLINLSKIADQINTAIYRLKSLD